MAVIPVTLGFAVLSGNYGRMFFGSYIVVIPYVLVFVARMAERFEVGRGIQGNA